MRFLLILPLFLVINFSCQQIEEAPTPSSPGLKDYYAEFFPIGASVASNSFSGPDSVLLIKEFNSITPENMMKMGPIHPKEDTYNWEHADRMIDFAEKHGLKVRGHTLCWHNQVGNWMFVDENGNQVSKDTLLQRLKDHIQAVAGRYKGKIYAWDVVNEVISDQAGQMFRPSKWYEICGEDFIYKAFEFAHKADPDALLFYNDYNATKPDKRDKIVKLLIELKDRGIPVHGMGLQGHWSIYGPSEQGIKDALDTYSKLGLDLQITELDVSIYPSESGRRNKRVDESEAFTPELEQQQLEKYQLFFKVFRDYRAVITGVTFWNISDHHSWLDNFPVRGRKNYPLLFDQERKRKKAYYTVVEF